MKIKEGFVLRTVMGNNVVVAVGEASKSFRGMIKLNGTATAIWKLIEEGKIAPKAAKGEKAACHDDDRLARTFYEFEPIRAMSAAAGYENEEMFNQKNLAKSCGSAVALGYMPEITVKVAGGRWDDLKRTQAKTMLVANPQAYICLEKAIPEGYKLVDLYGQLL